MGVSPEFSNIARFHIKSAVEGVESGYGELVIELGIGWPAALAP